MIQAVVFDLDGILLDTENVVRRSWQLVGAEYGISDADAIFIAAVGTTRQHACQLLRESHGTDFPAEEFQQHVGKAFYQIVGTDGIPLKTGTREILAFLREHDMLIGLASSTRQEIVERELTTAGILDQFDDILGGDQLEHSKPAPDIYLAACSRLGVAPENAIAVEDSYNGIRSASAAGMTPIMIPDLLPPTEEMRALSRRIFTSLHEFKDAFLNF